MPGETLPNMLITLPSLGGDSGNWDDLLNAALMSIDEHDHTSDKGARVPAAGLDIDEDLTIGGNALTSVGKVAFTAIAALAAGSKTLFVSSSDNELYWRTNAGTNVKLTSGTSINTSLVGGIVGDYSTVGAEVAFEDATGSYTFKKQNTKPWALIRSGEVRIYESNTTETFYTGIAAAAGLASSYTITLPAAVPGSQALMQMSTAGVMSFSNTLTQDIVATDFRHTDAQTLDIPGCGFFANGATNTILSGATSGCIIGWTLGNSLQKLTAPVLLKDGDVITGYVVNVNKTTNTTSTITARLYKVRLTTVLIETETLIGAGNSSAANAPGAIVLTETGLSEPVDAGNFAYYIMVGYTVCVAFGDHVLSAKINFTRP